MIKDCLIAAFCCLALACPAQTQFRAYSNSVEMLEGGRVNTLEVLSGNERITVRVPRGFASSVEEARQRVVFTDKTGVMTITLQVTTNWPGAMPEEDILRSRALAANPGGNFLQLATSPTSYRPAKFVDSFRTVGENLTIKRRHAFVSCPEGLVELALTANSADFEKSRLTFGLMLSSFQFGWVTPPAAPVRGANSAPSAQ